MTLIPHELKNGDDATAAFLELGALPVEDASPVAAIARLTAELAVRDHIESYADAFDSKDLDRIVAHFAPDARLTTPRAALEGQAAIRGFYEPFTLANRFSYHRIQSVIVRITAESALVAAYFHALFIGEQDDARSQYGRYFGLLRRSAADWLIGDWRILVDHTRAYPGSLRR